LLLFRPTNLNDMYEYRTEPFGEFEKHILTDSSGKHQITFVPDYGACLLSMRLQGTEVLDGYTTPIELDLNRWGKSGLLFPFPNRLANGLYEWGGMAYRFPINDPTTGTALHGFGMDKAFKVVTAQTEGKTARIACRYEYDGKFDSYPFPFAIQVDYELSDAGAFQMSYTCWNTGEAPLPWGFGWHPYFCVSERVEDTRLQIPPMDMIGVDEQMIPTGKRYAYTEFIQPKLIGATVLDNCFAPTQKSADNLQIQLEGERGKLTYWQETGLGKLNYTQLFTPPDRKSIAIEPMSCNVDAFNNQDGLIKLQPGDQASGRFGVRFQGRE